MLYQFLLNFVDIFGFLNVFKYLTFRTGLSVVTSLVIVFIIGGPLIKLFSEKMITGPIRQDGPIDHIIKKSGTPTMGGVIIIIGIISGTLLWADLRNIYVWVLIFVSLSLGGLGLTDDILKIKYKNSRGLKSSLKFLGQLIIGVITLTLLIKFSNHQYLYNLYFPFFKNLIWQMGLFFIPFGLFVIIGASNAVNLTDGLDGLATVPVMLVALSFTLISYVVGNTIFSEYLQIQYIPDVGELSIFCGSVVGACLGFLWYNAPPAKIFMGDTGSLVIGLILSILAIKLINDGIEIPNDKTYKNKGPFIVIAILSVPLYDTFRVFCLRLLSGYHPLRPDRNHIHHALLDLGCSHKKASLILYGFSILNIIISFFMIKLSLGLSIFLLSIFVLGLMAVPFVLLELKKNKSV